MNNIVIFNDDKNKFEDNIRRDLVFNVGGRPYNNRDFESIQKNLNDTAEIFNNFYDSNGNNNWLIAGFERVSNLRKGTAGLAWLNGHMYYIPSRSLAELNASVYIAAINNTKEQRQYSSGSNKDAFNVYAGQWLTEDEKIELKLNDSKTIEFKSEDDIDKAFLNKSGFVSKLEVLNSDCTEELVKLAGDIQIQGGLGIDVYSTNDGVIEIKQNTESVANILGNLSNYYHPKAKTNLSDISVNTSGATIIETILIDIDTRNEGHIDDVKISTRELSATDLSVGAANKIVISNEDGKLQASSLNAEHLVPTGGIIMYSGIATNFDNSGVGLNIWQGWNLCNGENGTPSMYNNFIIEREYTSGDDSGQDVYYKLVYVMKM